MGEMMLMRPLTLLCIPLLTLALLSCGGTPTTQLSDVVDAQGDTVVADQQQTSDVGPVNFPLVAEATITTAGEITTVTLAENSCLNVTATPVIADGFLLLAMGKSTTNCAGNTNTSAMLGYRFADRQLYTLNAGSPSSGSLLVDVGGGRVVWPQLRTGAFSLLALETFTPTLLNSSIATSSDSSAIWFNDLVYIGTANPPLASCQGDANTLVNKDCGALFAVDLKGAISARLDVDRGFRGAITASPSTDGVHLYLGTGAQRYGSEPDQYRHGCSVVKLDRTLGVVGRFDPGDSGCRKLGDEVDAVVGEIAVGPNSLWAQFGAPNDDKGKLRVVQLDSDLAPRCEALITLSQVSVAAERYQGPTIDANGVAFVTYNLAQDGLGTLFKIDLNCNASQLVQLSTSLHHSPTLVDDSYVLLASGGKLRIYLLNGTLHREYGLASPAPVTAAPIVAQGVIIVVANDGALTMIANSGLKGYGNAAWPRFRHDNLGSATKP